MKMPTDEKGLAGRQCPNPACGKYFKLKSGTGLKGEDLPCHCPYCGFVAGSDEFTTPEQMEYVKAITMNHVSNEIHRMLKRMEFDHKPRGAFGIGISMKVTGGPQRFHYSYREKELETDVVCDQCTLVYAIYGAFAFCPDCGSHNSFTILGKNLELAEKLLALAATQEREMATSGWRWLEKCRVGVRWIRARAMPCRCAQGHESIRCRRRAVPEPHRCAARVQRLFGFDITTYVTVPDWEFACRCFPEASPAGP